MDRLQELSAQFSSEPLAVMLEAKLDKLENGVAVISAIARDDLLIVSGIVQGGVTAILADYAGVYAAMSSIPAGFTPAANINIDLIHPIRGGERFTAWARVVSEGKNSIRTEVDVTTGSGLLVAAARIVFAKPRP